MTKSFSWPCPLGSLSTSETSSRRSAARRWTDLGRLAVDTAVNVACWCETDHATHDVEALRLVVGEETSLPKAFRAGAEHLTGWLADPHDADHWRAKAGLPPRWIR
jgi:hypothetical protein